MLENRYRAYLAVLNERRLGDLVDFVHAELTYNDEPMTRAQYRDLIAADIEAIPDLFFDAHLIVATDDQVACRLVFSCTPRAEFLGFTPNRRSIVTEGVSSGGTQPAGSSCESTCRTPDVALRRCPGHRHGGPVIACRRAG
jgi:predicted ester cyclase